MKRVYFRESGMRRDGKVLPAFCAMALCLPLFARTVLTQVPKSPTVSDDEYRVYSAVFDLMQFPVRDPHIIISDATLNFKCGEDSGNPTLANGCSFLAIPPD